MSRCALEEKDGHEPAIGQRPSSASASLKMAIRRGSRIRLGRRVEPNSSLPVRLGVCRSQSDARVGLALLISVVALALVATAGCGGDPGGAPDSGPRLAFDKEAVEVGGVVEGREALQTFLAFNRGDEPLRLEPPELTALNGTDLVESVTEEIVIPPGEAAPLPIRLVAIGATGPHEIAVTVPSNDPRRASTGLSIRFDVSEATVGTEAGPRLTVDKKSVDIGTVPYDWPLFEQFIVHNSGDEALVLDGQPSVRTLEGC